MKVTINYLYFCIMRCWSKTEPKCKGSIHLTSILTLQKAGITLKVDNQLPNLVNLNEDPQISEILLYNIKEGTTKVGRMGYNSKHDIQLNGALIADNHW